jgi:hypothetical protein
MRIAIGMWQSMQEVPSTLERAIGLSDAGADAWMRRSMREAERTARQGRGRGPVSRGRALRAQLVAAARACRGQAAAPKPTCVRPAQPRINQVQLPCPVQEHVQEQDTSNVSGPDHTVCIASDTNLHHLRVGHTRQKTTPTQKRTRARTNIGCSRHISQVGQMHAWCTQ